MVNGQHTALRKSMLKKRFKLENSDEVCLLLGSWHTAVNVVLMSLTCAMHFVSR